MTHTLFQKIVFPLTLAMGLLLLSGQASADKSEWVYKNKQQSKHEQRYADSRDDDHSHSKSRKSTERRYSVKTSPYFSDRHRVVIHDYYVKEYRRGYCPPGLVSAKNGCVARGQSTKWVKGKRMPSQVVYYDLPPKVVVNLGRPPAGHRYVRVANDILLITIGTSLIVDVMQGWAR